MQQKFHLNFIETAINSGSKKVDSRFVVKNLYDYVPTFFLIFDLRNESLFFSIGTLELDWNLLKN